MRAIKKARSTPLVVTVRRTPGSVTWAIVSAGPLTFRAAIGKAGRTAFKREGDGKTPLGAMMLMGGYYRADRLGKPRTMMDLTPIRDDMAWCDAPEHACYNRLVHSPFGPSHERMKRDDNLYDICLVMDWNISARARYRGSAIFFHLARPGFLATEGCIAVKLADMRRLLAVMKSGTVVRVI